MLVLFLTVIILISVGYACHLAWPGFVERVQRETFEHTPGGSDVLAVSDAYMRALDRAPTETELNAAIERLRRDPGYTLATLETQLVLSPERRRQVATQTNALRTDLEGVFTRGHVRLRVRAVHTDLTGAAPTSETEAFLVDRYVASGMDERELIRTVRAISIVPVPVPESGPRARVRAGARRPATRPSV